MNFKRLLLFLAAPLALVMSSCEEEGPIYSTPKITITDASGAEVTALNFDAEVGTQTITITANHSWTASENAEWLSVTPASDNNTTMLDRTVEVQIKVVPNDGDPRSETLKVVMDKIEKSIAVHQADQEGNTTGGTGEGTLESPYDVARAMNIILEGTYTEDMVYTEGIISELGEDGRAQFGNYTFSISDDGTTAGQLLVYRCKYFNGKNFTTSDNLAVGDKVIICGQLVNFKGNTPEIQSCYIAAHNGEMPDAPVLKEGVYASDAAFVCNIDNSNNAVYSLGDTNVGGNDVSGFKLGTGSKAGVFTSQAIGVSGDKYLNFYAVAWNGKTATLYYRVNGGEAMSQALVANAGANNNAPYNGLVVAATDHYSVKLTGLQATDKIEFSTNSSFSTAEDDASGRAIVFGVKLTDEALEGEAGSGSGDSGSGDSGDTTAPENALLWASFATSMDNFTAENVELGGLDYVWYHDATYKQMKASAYKDDVRYATESYLVSPVVALTGAEDYYMNFEHTGKYFSNMSEQATLWVREEGGTWAQLTIPTYMTGNDWTFVSSGDIALTAYAGKNIQIGFRYTSTTTDAPTWEVKNVLVAKGTASETPETPEQPSVEIPEGAVVWTIGASNQTWAAESDATLGAGFAATVDNLKVGYYQHNSTSEAKTAYSDHIRVYKSSALVITPLDGKTITKVIMLCSDAANYDGKVTHYTFDLSVADGSTATANQDAKYITWEGSTEKFEAYAVNGQVRIKTLAVVLEGEGSGDQGGEEPEPEDPEDPETPVEPTVATIASVVALGEGATVAEGTFVEGVVISNSELNNLTSKKGLYIQDETAGLQFYCAANHSFAFGDKVKVDLSGVTVGAYGGAVQISSIALDKFEVLSSGNAVEAKTVSMADFLANKYEGQYIALEGVQVAAADLAKTWGDANQKNHISINMEDAEGNNFVVFSSKYASYAAETVAQGSGTIKGISSINVKDGVTTMQIIFAQATDYAGLTGERFGDDNAGEDPETPVEPETLATLDANAYYVFKQATEFVPGKWYAIVAENNAATAVTGTYGYLKVVTPIALTDGISLPASCAWGVVSTEGGYTIQQYDGKYVYQTGSYDSFNVDATAPTSGHVWTIENGVITNATTAKTVQFDTQYNSYGCYASVKGVYPMFYELVEGDTNAHLLGTSVSSLSFTAEAGEKTFDVTTYGEATLDATTAAEWLTVSVDDGVVTVVAEANEGEAREAEVTVTYGEDSATVTVAQAAPLAEGAAAWVLVTDAATLAAGDQIVIVATGFDKALSATQNKNNRASAAVTKSGNTVVIDDTIQVITLEAGSVANTFAFNVGTAGYLYAASSSSNYLKSSTTLNENASWAITIDGSGVATIKASGSNTRNWMRYNNQNDLFSCYGSGQTDIAIYKYTE